MPVVQWVAHVLRATFWLAFNLAIVTGVVPAVGPSGRPARGGRAQCRPVRAWPGLLLAVHRGLVVAGPGRLQAAGARRRRRTSRPGRQSPRALSGAWPTSCRCPSFSFSSGRFADWAWAGIHGDDIHHPARDASIACSSTAVYAFEHAGSWVPWAIAGVIVYRVARAVMGAQQTPPAAIGGRQAQDANQVALQKLKQEGGRDRGQRARSWRRPARPAPRPSALRTPVRMAPRCHGSRPDRPAKTVCWVH